MAPLPDDLLLRAYTVSGSFAGLCSIEPTKPSVSAEVRTAIRSLLRWGGYKPAGRGRPASEAIAKALENGRWPCIHPLVDECNRLSLESGVPVSVVDLDRLELPLSVRLGRVDEEYAFNPSGQVLSLAGLLLLADAQGPSGSPVKDSQRSKISLATRRALIVVWGTAHASGATDLVADGLKRWCGQGGVNITSVSVGE